MVTATPNDFVLYKPYMPIISLLKAFFKIFTFEKILTFALRIGSICLVLSGLFHVLDPPFQTTHLSIKRGYSFIYINIDMYFF